MIVNGTSVLEQVRGSGKGSGLNWKAVKVLNWNSQWSNIPLDYYQLPKTCCTSVNEVMYPSTTTSSLSLLHLSQWGNVPLPLNYIQFPKSCCTSVNEEMYPLSLNYCQFPQPCRTSVNEVMYPFSLNYCQFPQSCCTSVNEFNYVKSEAGGWV